MRIKKSTFLISAILLSILLYTASALTYILQVDASTSPATVASGNDGYITLTLTNAGTTSIDSIKVRSIKIDSPIALKTTSYLENLGGLGVSKAMSVVYKFNVPLNAPSGFYTVEFLIDACTTTGTCDSYVKNALIKVQSPTSLEIVDVSPSSLKAGESTKITFTLKNSGKTTVNNVKISWDDPADTILPLGSDNKKFVSSIAENVEAAVPIDIITKPGSSPGIYSLVVSIEYDDQTGTKQSINSTVGLKVVGDFDFIVSLDSQDIVAPGMEGKADIKIANAGTQEALFLTVNVLSSDVITNIKPSEIYVGNIKSDDYDTETLTFSVANVATGDYPIDIEISYKDVYGNPYSEKHDIDITVSTKDEAAQGGSSNLFLYIVILAIVAYLLYRKIIKKKK
ncbi:MAG: hypothetical protein V1900_04795 [Candidatus Aenigmatarchaeota archaeon]